MRPAAAVATTIVPAHLGAGATAASSTTPERRAAVAAAAPSPRPRAITAEHPAHHAQRRATKAANDVTTIACGTSAQRLTASSRSGASNGARPTAVHTSDDTAYAEAQASRPAARSRTEQAPSPAVTARSATGLGWCPGQARQQDGQQASPRPRSRPPAPRSAQQVHDGGARQVLLVEESTDLGITDPWIRRRLGVAGDEDHRRRVGKARDAIGHLHSVEARQAEVEEDDVGTLRPGLQALPAPAPRTPRS